MPRMWLSPSPLTLRKMPLERQQLIPIWLQRLEDVLERELAAFFIGPEVLANDAVGLN